MKKNKITLKINGKKISADKGLTILEITNKNKIDIPALCYHPDLPVKANCRLCVIEIKGCDGLYTACSTQAQQGMEVKTESPQITRARQINLELIFAQHCEECADCIWNFDCELLRLAKKYSVARCKFPDRKKNYPVYEFGPSIVFDSTKCIDCRNCVDICNKQAEFLDIKQKGHLFQIVTSKKNNCIFCGQCIIHCPVGAFEAVGEFEDISNPLEQKDKIVVFQIAPSIRTSIGEEFDMPHGSVVTEQIAGALKKLGADKVFDVSVGADFTTIEEAKELLERIEKNLPLPMFTSCCPSWVRHVELNHKELIPHLTTVRSPHMISGGLIKTYLAKKEKIDPKKIFVVSIMPCTSKKYEITRKEMKLNGLRAVDTVMTTRELAHLFKINKIDLKTVKPKKLDNALGIPTGAGVIYGASGGVMESALRTACEKITGKCLSKIEFKNVRGQEGIKKATLSMNNKKIKIAVVNGIHNAEKILEELKENPASYHYIEVMACPGGCIGGGGQPVPTNREIREKRAQSLYNIDTKNKLRISSQNPIVKKVYKNFLNNKKTIHHICHTKYSSKSSTRIKQQR
jgi:NADH-quinone oxidoreductase subunit G/NADP-reducing hydrogenase subunit HndD